MKTAVLNELPGVAPLPTPRSPRYETLTICRGIAGMFVVVFHLICIGDGLAREDREASREP